MKKDVINRLHEKDTILAGSGKIINFNKHKHNKALVISNEFATKNRTFWRFDPRHEHGRGGLEILACTESGNVNAPGRKF